MSKYAFGDIAINSTEKKKPESSDKATYIGLEHLDSGNLTVRRFGADVAPIGDKLVMKKGDVLFGKRRAYQKKVAIAPFDGIFSAHGMVLRPKTEVVDKAFFPLFIASDYFLDAAIRISVGSLSPTINWRDLKVLEFSLPPLDEQRRLAKVLWAALDLKEAYQTMLARCDEMASSRFVEMFGDPNSINAQDKITDGFEIRDDLRKPLNDATRAKMHTGVLYPYYGANGQVDSINQFMFDGTALCVAEDCGSYGIGERSSYIISGKCWVNNHAHVLFAKTNCNITFAMFWFNILDITKFISGTTRTKLTQSQMRELPFKVFPLSLQNEFAAFIEQLDKSKVALQKNIERLDILIKTLLQEHFG